MPASSTLYRASDKIAKAGGDGEGVQFDRTKIVAVTEADTEQRKITLERAELCRQSTWGVHVGRRRPKQHARTRAQTHALVGRGC